jgi:uncharacterized protein YbjT (DUF2867 family)
MRFHFIGNALDAASFAAAVPKQATFIHLVGTPHPSPAKAAEFTRVDLASIHAATIAATQSKAIHFIYLSVAHLAPIMQAYISVRQEGEALVQATGIPVSIVQPWYVLGPGHCWPYALMPIYAILKRLPATRQGAQRLDLVTRTQLIVALLQTVKSPPAAGTRIVNVPAIKQASRLATG